MKTNEILINKILSDKKKPRINIVSKYKNFFKIIYNEKNKIIKLLSYLKYTKKVVIGYGVSTKSNVILQFCN